MKTHEHINVMWRGLRDIINAAYASDKSIANSKSDEIAALRDYAENISWHDDLEKLLREETANEKQHRGTRAVRGFSSQDAAKLVLCGNVLQGARLKQIPSALTFITFRKGAAEANLLGWLVREFVTPEWSALVEAKDYSQLMKAGEVERGLST